MVVSPSIVELNASITSFTPPFATRSTMEGDTTNFYISRKLSGYDVVVSVIARGISVGDELEYTDEVTLGRALLNRTVMNNDNNER